MVSYDPEMVEQLFLPIEPKPDSVKAAVLDYLRARPDGSCRRDFALELEVYELSARIGELKKDGWHIITRPCSRHRHRRHSQFLEYRLG